MMLCNVIESCNAVISRVISRRCIHSNATISEALLRAAVQRNTESLRALADILHEDDCAEIAAHPNGIQPLLSVREAVLRRKHDDAVITAFDDRLRTVLCSAYKPSNLTVRRITRDSPSELQRQLFRPGASVHPIQSSQDLHRRLRNDRRVYGLFHKDLLPSECIAFVQIAYQRDLPSSIDQILLQQQQHDDDDNHRVAVFYSLSSTQPGLRGVEVGNHLFSYVHHSMLRQVHDRGGDDGDDGSGGVTKFATLSPIPGFRQWAQRTHPTMVSTDNRTQMIDLCMAYMRSLEDPVTRFHCRNGAALERINFNGDMSARGMEQSYGLMANYTYYDSENTVDRDENRRKFESGHLVSVQ